MRTRNLAGLLAAIAMCAACVAPAEPIQRPSTGPSASLAASPQTTPAPSAAPASIPAIDPSASPVPTDAASSEPTEPPATDPPAVEPSLPPPPGDPRLAGVTSTWRGGCGAVFDGPKMFSIDDCGPTTFSGLLDSAPIRVVSGARLVVRPPDGFAFSWVSAHQPGAWTLKLATAAELAGVDGSDVQRFPTGIGTILAHGRGPDVAVVITMPTRSGVYVVEYDGPLAKDGWTFAASAWYWLVRVV